MSFEELGSCLINSEIILKKKISGLVSNGPDGEIYTQVGDIFHRLGCGSLLMDLDVHNFDTYLYCGGIAYLEQLRFSKRGVIDNYYSWLAHATPFIDALAINAHSLALSISENCNRKSYATQGEDQDRHNYMLCLFELIESPKTEIEDSKIYSKYKELNADDNEAEVLAIESIYTRDQNQFDETIVEFIDSWKTDVNNRLSQKLIEPYDIPITPYICIEGLALLYLARLHGMNVYSNYPYIPGEVLNSRHSDFPTNFSIL